MPIWTVSVTLDKGSDTSGDVTAIWDIDGEDRFSHSERAATSIFDKAAFKARAIAARNEASDKRASEAAKAAAIAIEMNGV